MKGRYRYRRQENAVLCLFVVVVFFCLCNISVQASTSHKDVAGMEVDTSIKTSINDEDSAVAMDFTENSSPLSPLSPHTEPWGDGGSSSGSITRVSYPGCPALTLRDGELEGSCAVCKIEVNLFIFIVC